MAASAGTLLLAFAAGEARPQSSQLAHPDEAAVLCPPVELRGYAIRTL